MELVNATRKAIDSGLRSGRPGRARGAEAVAILLSLVAPYTAEEMWERLGHEPTVAQGRLADVDEALLVEESVTASCRSRARSGPGWRSPRRSPRPTWRRWRWPTRRAARPRRQAQVRKVIVRAPKLVNIVAG
jgi:leucyl-tRNA synthetase